MGGLPAVTPTIKKTSFFVSRSSFGLLKIVFYGVVLAQHSNTPRAIKNGLLIVWLKGSVVNLHSGFIVR
jgi:hypothetical protein